MKKSTAVTPAPAGKERITIRLDTDILRFFRDQVETAGGNYQTMINDVLRAHIDSQTLEQMLRRILREELQKAIPNDISENSREAGP